MSLNCSEISTYEKLHFELKNVQIVLGILLKTILKIRNKHFYKRTSISNFSECYPFLIQCPGFFKDPPHLDLLCYDCTRNHTVKSTGPTGSISDKKA